MKPLHPLAQGKTPRDTAQKTRGICPKCGKNVPVTKAGKCRTHEVGGYGGRVKKTKCPGSGQNARSLYS